MKKPTRCAFMLLLSGLAMILPGPGLASPAEDARAVGAPPELAQWAQWVLDGEVGYQCVYQNGSQAVGDKGRVCLSVSPFSLGRGDQLTRFSFTIDMQAPGTIDLPSAAKHWPQDIRVDGAPANLQQDIRGHWQIVLPAGRFQIQGQWPGEQAQIQVPAVFAHAIDLASGEALPVEQNTVWAIGRPGQPVTQTENAAKPTAQVWRLLEDAALPRLTTQIRLTIPDADRLVLGPVLPEGFEPVSWSGNAQMALQEDGSLHVQAGRGTVSLDIVARCTKACAEQPEQAPPTMAPPKPKPDTGPWPASETWSFQANPQFRHLVASGHGVDPTLANVPAPWSHLPAFRVNPTQGLSFRTVSRGQGAATGEGLKVARRAWKTPDQWLQLDWIHGQMPNPGRLELATPHRIEAAFSVNDPLPLTVSEEGEQPGVQWPTTQVDLLAQSTRPEDATMTPGWNQPLSDMWVLLHLPIGDVLLAAPRNANVGPEWIHHFTLLRFFGIALMGFIIYHLRQRPKFLAPLAVVLAAGWVHNTAAQMVLFLLAGMGVMLLVAQSLGEGKARMFVRVMAGGALALALLAATPFIINQAHYLLYPAHQPNRLAHEDPWHGMGDFGNEGLGVRFFAGSDLAYDGISYATDGVFNQSAELSSIAPIKMMRAPAAPPPPMERDLQENPMAGLGLAQAGVALPQWPMKLTNSYMLHYPGPIMPEDGAHTSLPLWILPAWATWITRLLGSLGMLVLLGALGLRLMREFRPSGDRADGPLPHAATTKALGTSLGSVAAVGLFALGGLWADPAKAMPPPPENPALVADAPGGDRLDELKRRLLAPPACAPTCATLIHASLRTVDGSLHATYHLFVQAASTWTPPQPQGGLVRSVRVNQTPGMLHGSALVLPQGQVRVEIVYQVDTDPFVLVFDKAPLQVAETISPGWSSQGVDEHQRLDAQSGARWTLKKQDRSTPSSGGGEPLPQSLHPVALAHLERTLHFGQAVTIKYKLTRLDPIAQALSVSWPKLPGESVDNERIEQGDGKWIATLPAADHALSWTATLPPSTHELTLQALPSTLGQETWQLASTPAWQLDADGVPSAQAPGMAHTLLMPLPSETLAIQARRLATVEGPTQRLDVAQIHTHMGQHTAEHTITLKLFTTQATSRGLQLPAGATLVSVSRNGQDLPLPLEDRRLDVPLERGEQTVDIVFQAPSGNTVLTAPAVDLGGETSNLHWSIDPGQRRWILAAGGPGTGPAIFYWPLLVVFLIMAWAISRLPNSPLSLRTALLLTLGLSMLPLTLVMLVSIAAWLWVITYRRNLDPDSMSIGKFRAVQVGFVGLTGWCGLLVLGNLGWGLIGANPDMMIRGFDGQSGHLGWYLQSHGSEGLPQPWVFSLPVWVYQAILLAWALWFTAWLFAAVKRALVAFGQGGHWRSKPRRAPPTP